MCMHTNIAYVNIDSREEEEEEASENVRMTSGQDITANTFGYGPLLPQHERERERLFVFSLQSIQLFWIYVERERERYTCVWRICAAIDYKRVGGATSRLRCSVGRMWIVSRRSVVDVTAITARISANEIKLAAKAMRIVGKREEYLLLRLVEAHLDSSIEGNLSPALGN